MKTFEEMWATTGRQYGREELEGVKLGWELAQAALVAEPTDEAAEHRECARVYNQCQLGQNWDPGMFAVRQTRIQARTEGFVLGASAGKALNPSEMADEVASLEGQLSAAQQEIEKLSDKFLVQSMRAGLLETKLSASRAEIERKQGAQSHEATLHGQTLLALQAAQAEIATLNKQLEYERDLHGEINVLETKLENLRIAAVRYRDIDPHVETVEDWEAYKAAIEASR